MSKAEDIYLEYFLDGRLRNCSSEKAFLLGYRQAGKDVAEAFSSIIRGNLGGIGNDIQNMFEQLYNDITGKNVQRI